jgi:hypothetical protein
MRGENAHRRVNQRVLSGGPMKKAFAQERYVLPAALVALALAGGPVFAQANPNETDLLQARIKEAGDKLGAKPQFKSLSPKYRQGLAEFVTGNMLFVILHELGHTTITQMGLPVLGRPEDAADSFAAVGLIRIGSTFTESVLNAAAKGWFLADRRDKETDDTVAFYDEHGLNQQRAYQIVCFMVGSDEKKFGKLAEETKLPKERQDSCAGDFSNAAYSWDLLLKPHVRMPDQQKTDIKVVYGDAKGRLADAAEALKSIGLLEAVATHTAEAFNWPTPFSLEAISCGFPNARWDLPSKKLTVCYELAADFAELYRGYGPQEKTASAAKGKKKKTR